MFAIQIGLFDETKADDLLVVRLASFNQILDPWVYILFRKELFYRCCFCVRGKLIAVPTKIRKFSNAHIKTKEVTYKSEVTEMSDCFPMSNCLKDGETDDDIGIPSESIFLNKEKHRYSKNKHDGDNLLNNP